MRVRFNYKRNHTNQRLTLSPKIHPVYLNGALIDYAECSAVKFRYRVLESQKCMWIYGVFSLSKSSNQNLCFLFEFLVSFQKF